MSQVSSARSIGVPACIDQPPGDHDRRATRTSSYHQKAMSAGQTSVPLRSNTHPLTIFRTPCHPSRHARLPSAKIKVAPPRSTLRKTTQSCRSLLPRELFLTTLFSFFPARHWTNRFRRVLDMPIRTMAHLQHGFPGRAPDAHAATCQRREHQAHGFGRNPGRAKAKPSVMPPGTKSVRVLPALTSLAAELSPRVRRLERRDGRGSGFRTIAHRSGTFFFVYCLLFLYPPLSSTQSDLTCPLVACLRCPPPARIRAMKSSAVLRRPLREQRELPDLSLSVPPHAVPR